MGTKLKVVKKKCKCDHRWEKTADYSSVLALSGAFSCLKRSLGAKTSLSKVKQTLLKAPVPGTLKVVALLFTPRCESFCFCLFLCVNVSLLRLMPQTAPALSFIDAHHSLSLSAPSVSSPSHTPPSLSVMVSPAFSAVTPPK